MARLGKLAALGLAAILSACGGSSAGSGGATAGTSADRSNVLDACTLLDQAAVGQALGGTVRSTELSAVHDGGGGGERFSQCTYKFGDLAMLVFGAGESSDNVASLTTRFREQMQIAKVSTVQVGGVGKGALWNEDLHALWVFPGDGHYYGFTLYGIGKPDQKAAAIALARKFGL